MARLCFFFSIWVFFHEHSRVTGLQGKEEGISLTPHYHFHPLYRQLDISRAITAESSPLHIAAGLEPGAFGFRAQVANHEHKFELSFQDSINLLGNCALIKLNLQFIFSSTVVRK